MKGAGPLRASPRKWAGAAVLMRLPAQLAVTRFPTGPAMAQLHPIAQDSVSHRRGLQVPS